MGYVKSFRSIVKINEGEVPNFTENSLGVRQISKLENYQDIPELVKQLQRFENTSGIKVDKSTQGLELFAKLIAAQLKQHNIDIGEVEGYTDKLEQAVKGFQEKKGLPATGKVDHATYNVLFGANAPTQPANKSTKAKGRNSQNPFEYSDVVPYDQFKKIVAKVIDNLEGGYYHPMMMKKNPKKFKESVYGKSGETLFGLDRHAGHGMYYSTPRPQKERKDVFVNLPFIESGAYEYISKDAEDFWKAVDDADAKNNWEYNTRGGSLEPKLRELAGKIIKPWFNMQYSDNIKDENLSAIIKNDERLLFHFIYATWNGPYFWQKFAKAMEEAYKSGKTSPDELYQVAIDSRSKTAVTGSATKIIELYGPPTGKKSMRTKS